MSLQNNSNNINEDQKSNNIPNLKRPEYEKIYPPLKDDFIFDEENEIQDNVLKAKSSLVASSKNLFTSEQDTDELTEDFLYHLTKKPCILSKVRIVAVISKFIRQSNLIKKIEVEYQSDKKFKEEELSILCAEKLNYVSLQKGEILFKIGDIGDRFYIILSGKITILKLKELKIRMTYLEYLRYCMFLINNNEEYILNEVIKCNYKILPLTSEEEVRKIVTIIFKKQLKEHINLQMIISNVVLKLFFANFNQKFEDYNIDTNELEILQQNKLKSGKKTNRDWENYIIMRCKTTISENLFFEPFERVITDRKPNEIKCFHYQPFLYMGPGFFFGDSALDSDINRRNATIRAEEDSVLAYLMSGDYLSMISSKYKIEKQKDIDFLFNNFFFQDTNSHNFEKNYFHLFCPHEYFRGNTLFTNGTIPKSLIFLKRGKISLEFKGSILDIYNLLKYFCGNLLNNPLVKTLPPPIRSKLICTKTLNSIRNYANDPVLMRLKMHNVNFIEEMKKIRNYQVKILTKNEVIGLEEIFLKLPYIMKASVISETINVFEIGLDYFDKIINNEKDAILPYVKSSINKMLSLIERLQAIKQNYISIFLKKEKDINKEKLNQIVSEKNKNNNIEDLKDNSLSDLNKSVDYNNKNDIRHATVIKSTNSPLRLIVSNELSQNVLNKLKILANTNKVNKKKKNNKMSYFDQAITNFHSSKTIDFTNHYYKYLNTYKKSRNKLESQKEKQEFKNKLEDSMLIGDKKLSLFTIRKTFNELGILNYNNDQSQLISKNTDTHYLNQSKKSYSMDELPLSNYQNTKNSITSTFNMSYVPFDNSGEVQVPIKSSFPTRMTKIGFVSEYESILNNQTEKKLFKSTYDKNNLYTYKIKQKVNWNLINAYNQNLKMKDNKLNLKSFVKKQELIPGIIKDFYNEIKLNGYSYFAKNKDINTIYKRKFNKKYDSAEKISEKIRSSWILQNSKSLPKIF